MKTFCLAACIPRGRNRLRPPVYTYVSASANSVSPNRKHKDDSDNLGDPAVVGPNPGNMFGGARAFKDMFDDAMQGGCVEVRFVLIFSNRAPDSPHKRLSPAFYVRDYKNNTHTCRQMPWFWRLTPPTRFLLLVRRSIAARS